MAEGSGRGKGAKDGKTQFGHLAIKKQTRGTLGPYRNTGIKGAPERARYGTPRGNALYGKGR